MHSREAKRCIRRVERGKHEVSRQKEIINYKARILCKQYRSYMYKRGILRDRSKSEILLPLYPTVSSSIHCGYLEGTSIADAMHRALITRAELSITERARARARAGFVLYAHHPRVAHFATKINAISR